MKSDFNNAIPPGSVEYGSFKSYIMGFILSAIATLLAYLLTVNSLLSGFALRLTVAGLGIGQAILQLVLFLNLTREPRPRWNLLVFLFMVFIVLILVLGSIWIMENLNYNMMPH